jgi:cytochrome c
LLLTPGADSAPTAKAPGLAIAEHNACLGRHSIDESTVGPSFREIAERYRGVPRAEETLFAKVKRGGKGAWGEKLAMSHHMQVPDEEIRTLMRWVLALPKRFGDIEILTDTNCARCAVFAGRRSDSSR